MPSALTYPGVYIEEIPSGVRTITGVATSITAFVGRAARGPTDTAVTINSFGDFERIFGGLWSGSLLSFAVRDFYLNGGAQAIIVRLYQPAKEQLDRSDLHSAMAEIKDLGAPASADKAKEAVKAKAKALIESPKYRTNQGAIAAIKAVVVAAEAVTQSPTVEKVTTAVNVAAQYAANPKAEDQKFIEEKLKLLVDAAAGADVAAARKAVEDKATELKKDNSSPAGTSAGPVIDAVTAAAIAGTDVAMVKEAAETEAKKQNALARDAGVADLPPRSKAEIRVGNMTFTAASEGKWGAQIRIKIDQENGSKEIADKVGVPSSADLFNLEVQVGPQHERFLNLTVKESSRRVDRILATQSNLIRYDGFDPANPPVLSPGLDVISSAETEVNKAKQNCDAKERELDSWDKALEVAKKDDPQEAKQETKDVKNARDNAASELDAAKRQISEAEDKLKSERNIAIKVSDGAHLEAENILPVGGLANKKGLYALEQADLFNLLCIPPYSPTDGINFDIDKSVLGEVASYCERRRAMLLIDSPSNWSGSEAKAFARTQFSSTGSDAFPGVASKNAAMFFPRLMQSNPFRDGHVEAFAPCGAVAGVIARTDTQRGVWKAPAGLEATIAGSLGLEVNLTDAENGELNPIGLNCLRTFPFAGSVVWGARTLRGADQLADEWKYVPVRRTALFIEESLYRGTKWVVHQPNDEPLWAQIRLNVGAFMNDLFRQGAFQGQTPRDAYFVKCSSETTTPNDINKGVVNIHVGFAPLKPAEFVVIQLQQIAGQIQT